MMKKTTRAISNPATNETGEKCLCGWLFGVSIILFSNKGTGFFDFSTPLEMPEVYDKMYYRTLITLMQLMNTD
jgi:hypothetical protein